MNDACKHEVVLLSTSFEIVPINCELHLGAAWMAYIYTKRSNTVKKMIFVHKLLCNDVFTMYTVRCTMYNVRCKVYMYNRPSQMKWSAYWITIQVSSFLEVKFVELIYKSVEMVSHLIQSATLFRIQFVNVIRLETVFLKRTPAKRTFTF